MKVVTLIQARNSSTRLPGKVMLPVCGKPMLLQMIERVKKSEHVGTVSVITTDLIEDDEIFNLCLDNNISVVRGHPTDLLDRHYQAAKYYKADAIVKIPSDCPLIDSSIIDRVIKHYLNNNFDYVSNLHPATYPDGNDVEIMSFNTLENAWKNADKLFEREHTTPYIWENPDLHNIGNIEWETGKDFSDKMRWTIDYEEDYQFIKTVYEKLQNRNNKFTFYDVLKLLEEKPEIALLNKRHAGKYWYENHLDELNNIDEYKEKFGKVMNV
ncbi:MAG: glycosyltransferase family protein [Melioribacteraceae bacterium]|nr:glycosyltransferase family protein [Melioribacteraceae bacterium]